MKIAAIKSVKIFSKKLKNNIIDAAYNAGSSSAHIGGALSLVDIFATLYDQFLNLNKYNYKTKNRDRLILSKGHGCLVYYSALVIKGIITKKELLNFEKSGSFLLGHPVMNRDKGIEFSNGSLGMGLSLGIGTALALKKDKNNSKVFVILGDGECNEGSVWEAAMLAPKLDLDNLTVIIDKNGFQQTGETKKILDTSNLSYKWKSFNWNVEEINGHNLNEIHKFLKKNKKKPTVCIAKTIKGHGISFSENNNEWHHSILSKKYYELAKKETYERK
jgi:transketolase